MKLLNQFEISNVSGGILSVPGVHYNPVSSDGIPLQHFNVIENNINLFLNKKISEKEMYLNIINANSDAYLATYLENLFKANPQILQ
jgi:hypothetical protein